VATGRLLHRLSTEATVKSLAFAPNGRTLASGHADNTIRIWEVATGGQRLSFAVGRQPTALAFSTDGTLLATASSTGRPDHKRPARPPVKDEENVHLVDPWTGARLHTLTGHRGPVACLAFSPDGRLLASGSFDTTVLLWDAAKLPQPSRPRAVALTMKELEACWSDLHDTDAATAFRSMQRLAATPAAAVSLIEKHYPPVEVVEAKRLATLLADIDGAEFATREKASGELAKLGPAAESALRKALADRPSLEARRRIARLLKSIEGQHLGIMRAVEVLERLDTSGARRLLERLRRRLPSR
jgi:WD40 repeat protein